MEHAGPPCDAILPLSPTVLFCTEIRIRGICRHWASNAYLGSQGVLRQLSDGRPVLVTGGLLCGQCLLLIVAGGCQLHQPAKDRNNTLI